MHTHTGQFSYTFLWLKNIFSKLVERRQILRLAQTMPDMYEDAVFSSAEVIYCCGMS